MPQCVEIRTYELVSGTRPEFHRLMAEAAAPMLARWGVDVVFNGPSIHDADSYVLIRRYDDPAHRQQSQDAFYGSTEWREGPREAIVSRIAATVSVVLDATPEGIAAFRSQFGAAPAA